MDPRMGIAGSILVARWSIGLLRVTNSVLLDHHGPQHMQDAIRDSIEADDDNRVADLHLWCIGPNLCAVEIAVVSHEPQEPNHYKELIRKGMGLAHITIEVQRRRNENEDELVDDHGHTMASTVVRNAG